MNIEWWLDAGGERLHLCGTWFQTLSQGSAPARTTGTDRLLVRFDVREAPAEWSAFVSTHAHQPLRLECLAQLADGRELHIVRKGTLHDEHRGVFGPVLADEALRKQPTQR